MDGALRVTLDALSDPDRRVPLRAAPDEANQWYAIWIDSSGSGELSAVAPEPVPPGIVYAGQCTRQSVRKHLSYSNLGSFTLMRSLAALFRESWRLDVRRGGLSQLRDWMDEHLTMSTTPRDPRVAFRDVLTHLDPPLRLEGWKPERTALRQRLTAERALLDR